MNAPEPRKAAYPFLCEAHGILVHKGRCPDCVPDPSAARIRRGLLWLARPDQWMAFGIAALALIGLVAVRYA